MKHHHKIKKCIIIHHNKTQNNIVTYTRYSNTKKQHNKEQKFYNVQNNILVLRTNITRCKTML